MTEAKDAGAAGPDEALKRAAEREMARVLPDERPAKKIKTGDGDKEPSYTEIGRFDYSFVAQLASPGIQGIMVTCNFQR